MQAKQKRREKLAILGTSLFAPEVFDIADDIGKYEITCFIENWNKEKTFNKLLGKPIIWIEDAGSLSNTHKAVCSLGTTKRKYFIQQAIALKFKFATIIHPTARISKRSSVKEGSILSCGTVIAYNTTVGKHVIINRGSTIGHDTKIKDYVTIAPGVNIAGAVTIGNSTYIGIGATVLDKIRIGNHVIIGAGAVVTKDVPDRVQVIGIPARITKENISGR